MSNILENTLNALSVRHTKAFVRKIYDEDPEKENFRGMARMLNCFGVHASGYLYDDYHSLFAEHTPFIVAIDNHFTLVLSLSKEAITIETTNKPESVATNSFFTNKSGAVLLLEKSENVGEPDFKKHKLHEKREAFKIIAALVSLSALFGFQLRSLRDVYDVGEWFFVCLNFVALALCTLLVEKQIRGKSKIGDAVCMAFSHVECNSILDSTAAKPFLSLSWAELGFGFFMVNTAMAILHPECIPSVALLCLCSVFVPLWSLAYQFTQKEWCPLCVLAQICVILLCADIGCFKLAIPINTRAESYIFILLYPVSTLFIHYIARYCTRNRKREEDLHRIYPMAIGSDVFHLRLKKQRHIQVGDMDSSIIIGNPNAPNTLTIFSNPQCIPCAEAHKAISSILKRIDSFRIQYIFAAFSSEIEHDSRALISFYLNYDNSYESLLDEWFKGGMKSPDKFIKAHGGRAWDDFANEEIARHKKWAIRNRMNATPTLLLNGYVLPREYSIQDLVYIDLEQ